MSSPPSLRPKLTAALFAALALLATGCSAFSSIDGTGEKGYVSGDGTVRIIDAADRADPVSLTGPDLNGKPLDLASFRGKPVVIVVWGSWCAPCQAEAPDVVAAAREIGDRAHFVGIDLRDASTANALSYVRTYKVPYPSYYSPDGKAMLHFPGTLGPNSIPSFVVLDDQGRVAASILGALPSKETLVDLVAQVAGKDH